MGPCRPDLAVMIPLQILCVVCVEKGNQHTSLLVLLPLPRLRLLVDTMVSFNVFHAITFEQMRNEYTHMLLSVNHRLLESSYISF